MVELIKEMKSLADIIAAEKINGNDIIGLAVLLPETGTKIVGMKSWFNGKNAQKVEKVAKETTTRKTTRTASRMSYAEAEDAAEYIATKCNGNKIAKAMSKLSAYQKEKYTSRSLERFLRGESYSEISQKYFIVDERDKIVSILVDNKTVLVER